MKRCSKCKANKRNSEFGRNAGSKDGMHHYCRECKRVYDADYRAKNKTAARAWSKRWRDKNKGYHSKWREEHKELAAAILARRKEKYPEREKAKATLNNAVYSGKLDRPETCSLCNETGLIDGHHPDYSKPLEVIWLCRQCHVDYHRSVNHGC
jgi:hypothetical protein